MVLDTYNDLYLPYYWSHLIIWQYSVCHASTMSRPGDTLRRDAISSFILKYHLSFVGLLLSEDSFIFTIWLAMEVVLQLFLGQHIYKKVVFNRDDCVNL